MSTLIADFDYELPERLIAQRSVEPRDRSRLLVLDRTDTSITHRSFFEISAYLQKGDVLVMNKSKVFKARLRGKKMGGTIGMEVTLLRPASHLDPAEKHAARVRSIWEAMVYPGRRLNIGNQIALGDRVATVRKKTDTGVTLLEFDCSDDEVFVLCEQMGEVPVPPYVDQVGQSLEEYQTVYAQETGSVAAPTAGFHFTDRLLDELREKGVQIEFVTLHVGLGTFQPVKSDTLEGHRMHGEFVQIDAQTASRINVAKQEGRRVIAVGTTTTRALRASVPFRGGVADEKSISQKRSLATFEMGAYSGDVDLFITPGFRFQIVDGLITNFHLPKTTLLVLVSAFAGRDFVMQAYQEAVESNYRFYSFGDAMLIL